MEDKGQNRRTTAPMAGNPASVLGAANYQRAQLEREGFVEVLRDDESVIDADVVSSAVDRGEAPKLTSWHAISSRSAAGESRAETLAPGSHLGSYRLLKLLGTGAMGSVFLAEHVELGKRVAIKCLHSKLAASDEFVRRFFTEARAVSQMNHEHIVGISDFLSAGAVRAYVMDYLEGEDLASRLNAEGHLPQRMAIRIAVQLAEALEAVHSIGIVHRDVKPNNIFLVARPDGRPWVKLLDFGVAKFINDKALDHGKTAPGLTIGTPQYMAPEYIASGQLDARADIYAFGLVLYGMLTGRRPFQCDRWMEELVKQSSEPPPPPSTWVPVSPALEAIVLRCINKDPDRRPQTMREVREALEAIEPMSTVASFQVIPERPKRRLTRSIVGAFVGLAVLGGFAVAFLYYHRVSRIVSAVAAPAAAPVPATVSPTPAQATAKPGAPAVAVPAAPANAAPAPRAAAPVVAAPAAPINAMPAPTLAAPPRPAVPKPTRERATSNERSSGIDEPRLRSKEKPRPKTLNELFKTYERQ